jgi:hypothetical protein
VSKTDDDDGRAVQGWDSPLTSGAERRAAVDAAFDYRGDVTLTLDDGMRLVGFVSNRDFSTGEPFLEIMTADMASSQRIPLSSLLRIEFTGVDPAAGKSWDLWIKKVAEAEAQGKIAELYPDEH